MSKDDFEEDWVAEAAVSSAQAADSEFTRYKLELKRKAGLLDPWYVKMCKRVIRFFKR